MIPLLLFLWRPESQSAALAVDCTKGCRWRRQRLSYTLRNLTHTRISSAASVNCCPRSAQCQCSLADVSVWCLCDVAGQEYSAVALSRLNETRSHGTQTRHHVSIRSAVCMHDVCFTQRLCDWACDDGLMSGWQGEFCIGHNVFGMRCCFKLNCAGQWHVPWWYDESMMNCL